MSKTSEVMHAAHKRNAEQLTEDEKERTDRDNTLVKVAKLDSKPVINNNKQRAEKCRETLRHVRIRHELKDRDGAKYDLMFLTKMLEVAHSDAAKELFVLMYHPDKPIESAMERAEQLIKEVEETE